MRNTMHRLHYIVKRQLNNALDRDRSSERYVYATSRLLWPWRESRLIVLMGLIAIVDYASTYAILELSGKGYVHEVGWIASRALRIGGFGTLLLVDVFAVAGLLLAAIAIRCLCSKFGFKGFGRAMFVILLMPYTVMAFAASVNNLLLTVL